MEKDSLIPPKKDFANNIHEYINEITKTVSGGFINPLIDIILPSFHQKQFESWCMNVYSSILELDESKISKKDLLNNAEFISLLKENIIIASKNHQIEKLSILKNALIKSIGDDILFDKKIIYTKIIDTLTLQHLYIFKAVKMNLKDFYNTSNYSDIYGIISKNSNIKISRSDLIYILNELDKYSLLKVSRDIEEDEIVRQSNLFGDGYENKKLPYINVTEFGNGFFEYVFGNIK